MLQFRNNLYSVGVRGNLLLYGCNGGFMQFLNWIHISFSKPSKALGRFHDTVMSCGGRSMRHLPTLAQQ